MWGFHGKALTKFGDPPKVYVCELVVKFEIPHEYNRFAACTIGRICIRFETVPGQWIRFPFFVRCGHIITVITVLNNS